MCVCGGDEGIGKSRPGQPPNWVSARERSRLRSGGFVASFMMLDSPDGDVLGAEVGSSLTLLVVAILNDGITLDESLGL